MSLSRRVMAVLASITAGLLVFMAPASAATYEFQFAERGDLWAYEDAYSSNWRYGSATYEDEGDEIYVKDLAGDGMRVAAFWSIPSLGRTGLCVNKAGEQSLLECDKNFPEGHRIYIKFAGRCDGDVSSCRKLHQYSGGGATDSTDT